MIRHFGAALVAGFLLVGVTLPAHAVVITQADFTDGLSNQTINGVNFTANGGTFQHKTVAGVSGVGVSGGASGGEIDIGQSISATTAAIAIDSIVVAFLFDGPEFGDVNEVAKITIGVTDYFLTATGETTATWSGPGTVTNLSPASATSAAVWQLTGLGFTNVTSFSFTPIAGDCGTAGGACNNQSDFSLVSINAVPEPATMAVIGMGLLGIGLIRRRRAKA